MKNILLTIAYDGTGYYGWQKQPNKITVESELNKALNSLFNSEIKLIGAGRTDSGVHALGQCVLFHVENMAFPLGKLPELINKRLPNDIVVKQVKEVANDFHPRFNAVKKTYEYRILNTTYNNPLLSNYAEHVRKPLNIDLMKQASKLFLGKHDFKAFQTVGGTVKTSVRTILNISITEENWRNETLIVIRVTGDSFLYNMVRIMAGTLIDVGLERKQPEQISEIILSKDRTKASKTAGASGLTLVCIDYE